MILYKIYRSGAARVGLKRVKHCTLEHNNNYVNIDLASWFANETSFISEGELLESREGAE